MINHFKQENIQQIPEQAEPFTRYALLVVTVTINTVPGLSLFYTIYTIIFALFSSAHPEAYFSGRF